MSLESRWNGGGLNALALLTIAVESYDPGRTTTDGECLEMCDGVFDEMSREELEMALVWLGRLGAQSLIAVNEGDVEGAKAVLAEVGREMVKAELELEEDGVV